MKMGLRRFTKGFHSGLRFPDREDDLTRFETLPHKACILRAGLVRRIDRSLWKFYGVGKWANRLS